MFGIKTKKDKRIEELEADNFKLRCEVERLYKVEMPYISGTKKPIILTYKSEYGLGHDMVNEVSEEFIKNRLLSRIFDDVVNNIEIDYCDDPVIRKRFYATKIKVIKE